MKIVLLLLSIFLVGCAPIAGYDQYIEMSDISAVDTNNGSVFVSFKLKNTYDANLNVRISFLIKNNKGIYFRESKIFNASYGGLEEHSCYVMTYDIPELTSLEVNINQVYFANYL